jgi:hypothetical protein
VSLQLDLWGQGLDGSHIHGGQRSSEQGTAGPPAWQELRSRRVYQKIPLVNGAVLARPNLWRSLGWCQRALTADCSKLSVIVDLFVSVVARGNESGLCPH